MKKIIALILSVLMAGSVYAQKVEENKPRSGRQDKSEQTPPVKQNAQTKAKAKNGASQNATGQNATGNNPNRNEERVIGNKNDNVMQVDTASGTGATPPHLKTPGSIKEAASPEGSTNQTSTPNSMVASPATPDASNSYNRSSNGGLGIDHLPKPVTPVDKPNATSSQSRSGNKSNTTTAPAPGQSNTGGSASTNAIGQTKMGTTGTGYSTGSNAGENSGNTRAGNNAGNRTSTTKVEKTGKGKTRRDTLR